MLRADGVGGDQQNGETVRNAFGIFSIHPGFFRPHAHMDIPPR